MDRGNSRSGMQLEFISAQPASDYYAWQVEVQLNNFKSVGYDLSLCNVLASVDDLIPSSWIKLTEGFKDVKFFFYKNDHPDMTSYYPPVVQSLIMSKHFKRFPELRDKAFFFHDADFIFTKKLNFDKFLSDDRWYFSDTISYIGADYIKSKSDSLLENMAKVAMIDRSIIEGNQENSGGAQKLMKNLTSDYWDDVSRVTIDLFEYMQSFVTENKGKESASIQLWTASMWGELWCAWKRGVHVDVPKEFDFCWATCNIDRWNDVYFFHNAGVSSNKTGMFFKAEYIDKLPYDTDLELSDARCSYNYYKEIKSIKSILT